MSYLHCRININFCINHVFPVCFSYFVSNEYNNSYMFSNEFIFTCSSTVKNNIYIYMYRLWLWCIWWLSTICQLYRGSHDYSRGNSSTWRKSLICRKSLTNFITHSYCCIECTTSCVGFTRTVTIRSDDKVWFDSDLWRDRLRQIYFRTKTETAEKKLKHKVTNLITVMKIWQDSIIVVQLCNRVKIFVQNIGFLSGIICHIKIVEWIME
jgi:hypothetical protein